VGKNVIIVGGGIAGLAASIYLARAGRTVTVFEKRRYLGGRAITNLRQGFRFNLGGHTLFRAGAASAVYRELGIPTRGGFPKLRGTALLKGDAYRLPGTFTGWLLTSLLGLKTKLQFAVRLLRIRRLDLGRIDASLTVREWLDANVADERERLLLEALIRLTTYADHAETQSAAAALAQLKIALRGGIYVHEGWQKLVDSLHSAAVASGVNFVTSSRIVGVHHQDGAVKSVELGGLELDADRMDTQALAYPEEKPEEVQGARIPAETVILAVDPATAADLVDHPDLTKEWSAMRPVTAACLDISLRSLPSPKNTFALGLDVPVSLSAHSVFAQLAPAKGAIIHTTKFRKVQRGTTEPFDDEPARRAGAGPSGDELELEALLDRFQPGWRDVLVHRRFLPAMTVSNALVTPSTVRPDPVTPLRGLYLAGDWVGKEGMLSDAALASARAAAKAILATP
jgi:phytoene dehydrogenase-like protein